MVRNLKKIALASGLWTTIAAFSIAHGSEANPLNDSDQQDALRITYTSNGTKFTVAPDIRNNRLEMESKNITEVEFYGAFDDVRSLLLDLNKLTLIPQSITQFKNLKKLLLGHNQFSTFPESICSLKNLNMLKLTDNMLTEIPQSICMLENLQELYLDRNNFSTFPEALYNLEKLERLDLSSNELVSLPMTIFELGKLKVLSLRDNKITILDKYEISTINTRRTNINSDFGGDHSLSVESLFDCLQESLNIQDTIISINYLLPLPIAEEITPHIGWSRYYK